MQVALPVEPSALSMADAQVVIGPPFRCGEFLAGRGDHPCDRQVAAGATRAKRATEIEQSRVAAVVVRKPASVTAGHGVEERAVLEAFVQILAHPSILNGQKLVEVANQYEVRLAVGELR